MSVSEQRAPPPPPPQSRRQEPGSDTAARMPAWKREILERRKARQASPAADSRSWGPNSKRAASPSNREAEPSLSPGREAEPGGAVLLESIAPIHDNPFIQRERRRRAEREREAPGGGSGSGSSARPTQQLLELYSQIPGLRTIRADNIIIIESDPDYFTEAGLGPLLARGGVAEIRAAEVLIYEGPLSRSEENLSTLGAAAAGPAHLHGKVSRLLQKFDHNYVKPARSRSTENLLDGFSPARDRRCKPLLLPKPLALNKHSPGPAWPAAQASQPQGAGSPGPPPSDTVSPPHHKSSPPRSSAPLSPSRASSAPLIDSPDPGTPKLAASDRSVSEDRPYSVSSYRKQFENVPPEGWQLKQKDSPTRKVPSHRTNENILKDWASKETKLVENGLPELHLTGTAAFSVKEGEVDNEANGIGSARLFYSLSAPSNEVSKGTNAWRPKYVADIKKTSQSSPETSQPTASTKPSATPLGKGKQNHEVDGSAKVTPNQCNGVSASTSLNNSFQIVPATPPDFSSIPEDDIQARALANLKKLSKNSFVVIPKRKVGAAVCDYRETNDKKREKPKPENGASTNVAVQTSTISAVSSERISSSDHRQSKEGKPSVAEPPLPKADSKLKEEDTLTKPTSRGSYDVSSKHRSAQLSGGEGTTGLLPTEMSEAERDAESTVILIRKLSRIEDDLPVTNIDDILVTEEKDTPKQPTGAKSAVTKDKPPEESFGGLPHPFMQRKSGNTFTIVPQRKPARSGQEPSVNANGTDEQSVEDPDSTLAKLGVLLKKRYPPAEEIQVIGGYLSLERSCLSKGGSMRKQMKISFNDSSLHTTFEYPSESSLIQEGESEESEEEEEEEEPSSTFFFPRPSYTSSPTTSSSPLRTNTLASALSNYTPKHAMPFNTWQEQKLDENFSGRDSALQDIESTTEDDMLTPVDSSSHSDYSSEPALYF